MIKHKSIKNSNSWKKFKAILNKKLKYLKIFIKKNSKLTYIFIWILLFFISIWIFLDKTFLSLKHNLKIIDFAQQSIDAYDEPKLYKQIKKDLVWKNYFILKLFEMKDIIENLKKDYPIIDDISLVKVTTNHIMVNIKFIDPNIIFYDKSRILWSKDEFFFEIYTWSSLLKWRKMIDIPTHTNKYDDMDWFYYMVPEKKLKLQFDEVISFLWINNIVNIEYLPWWSKTIITLNKWQKIFFDNIKPITDQLNKYYIISLNYPEFDKLKEIDLWSSNDIIIKE